MQVPLYMHKGVFSGELQGRGGAVRDICLLAFKHQPFNFLPTSATFTQA